MDEIDITKCNSLSRLILASNMQSFRSHPPASHYLPVPVYCFQTTTCCMLLPTFYNLFDLCLLLFPHFQLVHTSYVPVDASYFPPSTCYIHLHTTSYFLQSTCSLIHCNSSLPPASDALLAPCAFLFSALQTLLSTYNFYSVLLMSYWLLPTCYCIPSVTYYVALATFLLITTSQPLHATFYVPLVAYQFPASYFPLAAPATKPNLSELKRIWSKKKPRKIRSF